MLKSPVIISPDCYRWIFSFGNCNNDTVFVFIQLADLTGDGKLWSHALFRQNSLQYIPQGSTVTRRDNGMQSICVC